MFILDICNNISILGTILFIKKIVNILSILVPILLVILITLDLIKAVIANSEDQMRKAQSLVVRRIIIGLAFFFIPLLINASFSLLGDQGVEGLSCYNNATDEKLAELVQTARDEATKKEEERQKSLLEARERIKEKQAQIKAYIEEAAARALNKDTSGGSSNPPAAVCTNCTSSEKIAQTAELLAWPNGTKKSIWHHNYPKMKKYTKWSELTAAKPTDAFKTAFDQIKPKHWTAFYSSSYGGWPAIGASCDKFVYTTVKYSGYDTKIPSGLANQLTYLPKSSKWKKVSSAGRGDICIKGSHIKVYLGNGKQAEAGYHSKKFGRIISGSCKGYNVYRAAN